MSYRPQIGDNFKLKGKNVFGDIILSESIYHCVQRDSVLCVAKNKDGVEFNFKYIKEHPFKYVKVD